MILSTKPLAAPAKSSLNVERKRADIDEVSSVWASLAPKSVDGSSRSTGTARLDRAYWFPSTSRGVGKTLASSHSHACPASLHWRS